MHRAILRGWVLVLAGGLGMAATAAPAAEPEGFEAEFRQERTTPGLERAFVTEGRVIWRPDERLEWRTESPFEYAYILYPDRIVEREPGGRERELDGEDVPWVVSLNELLVAVMSGDDIALNELFRVASREAMDEAGERLLLHPRDERLAAQIPAVRLEKDSQLRRVVIEEADGGRLDIRFFNYQGDEPPLPDDGADSDS